MALSAVKTAEFAPRGEFDTEVVPIRIWAASTAYVVGEIVRSSTSSGNYYQCTVAGTSGAAAPAWTITGTTVADNTVTWRDIGVGNAGDMVLRPSGLVAYVDGLQPLDLQNKITFRYVRTGFIPKAAGTTFVDGANVWFNTATGLAVATAPAQGFVAGVSRGDWRTPATVVLTALNGSAGLLFTANTLTFAGATGANEVVVPTNLAEALVIRDSAADVIVIETTTGTPVVRVTPISTFTGLVTLTGGATSVAVITATGGITIPGATGKITFTGNTGTCEMVVVDNVADALSIKDSVGGADIIVICTTNGSELVTFTPRTVHSGGARIASAATLEQGAAAGGASSATRLVVAKGALADNAVTDMITVTIPNAIHSAVLDLAVLGALTSGASTRCGRIMVAFTRVSGVVAVAVAAALDDEQIATSAAGETVTMAVAVSAVTGAAGASNSFKITIQLNSSAGATCEAVMLANLLNVFGTGVTMAAA